MGMLAREKAWRGTGPKVELFQWLVKFEAEKAATVLTHACLKCLMCRYETEFFQQQVDLEAEKAAAMSRARSLQVR
eukprot:scaffold111277_cov17-Tisochrysis_lutea.AAC.1